MGSSEKHIYFGLKCGVNCYDILLLSSLLSLFITWKHVWFGFTGYDRILFVSVFITNISPAGVLVIVDSSYMQQCAVNLYTCFDEAVFKKQGKKTTTILTQLHDYMR